MKDAWGLDWADWQKHKSGWTEKDFDKNWDIFICKEFHFYDAITNEKFEKPYWAMFAILNKNEKSKNNIYSYIRNIYWFLTHTLPLYFKSNNFLYNPLFKIIYRKIILKIIKK